MGDIATNHASRRPEEAPWRALAGLHQTTTDSGLGVPAPSAQSVTKAGGRVDPGSPSHAPAGRALVAVLLTLTPIAPRPRRGPLVFTTAGFGVAGRGTRAAG